MQTTTCLQLDPCISLGRSEELVWTLEAVHLDTNPKVKLQSVEVLAEADTHHVTLSVEHG